MKRMNLNIINYIRNIIYLYVLIGFSLTHAGSYDEFFNAIKLDDAAKVSALLSRGFDPNTSDPAGVPGLLMATKESAYKVVKVLLNHPKIKMEVRNAAMSLLLEENAYIDAASPNNTTPLMMAAHYSTPAAVKLLLEAGADPMLKNDLGLSAIDFALRAEHTVAANIIAAFVRGLQSKGTW